MDAKQPRMHAGKQVTSKRKLRRIIDRVDTVTKPRLIAIMQELEPDLKRKDAELAYDRVTAAINGWINSYTRDLPKGLHAKLLLANCFSVNLCWIKGRPGRKADFPGVWITITDRLGRNGPRGNLRKLRVAEYNRWVAAGRGLPDQEEGQKPGERESPLNHGTLR